MLYFQRFFFFLCVGAFCGKRNMDVQMAGLCKSRIELAAKVRCLTVEICSLRKRLPALPLRALHVVWLLFALGASPQDAVLVHLRPYVGSAHDDNDLLALAEESFVNANLQRIADLCDGSDAKALKLAKALLAEQRVSDVPARRLKRLWR